MASNKGSKGSVKRPNTRKRPRRSAVSRSNMMVLKLLLLVVVVLFVFEGRIILTMYRQHAGKSISVEKSSQEKETSSSQSGSYSEDPDASSSGNDTPQAGGIDFSENLAAVSDSGDEGQGQGAGSGADTGLAGLFAEGDGSSSSASGSDGSSGNDENLISEELNSAAVVPLQDVKTDDSYFRDAVFIGDSRMEGFRNTSGITQGEFMTSVGMSLSSISSAKVNTSDGEITVYQGLSGRKYGKIYLMLGANDLGYYPWEDFKPHVEEVMEQMHKLQPQAIIYICGVIYVEGYKISTDYVNNDNVRKVNGYLLEVCEELDYCWYLNLNEVFTNGYGSLIEGATADGVHLEPKYSAIMLDYLKSHYFPVEVVEEAVTESETE